ncbi:cytochrome P450 [Marmoricola sp. URHB0036]|uniref:cytochrome P450 n=1 Tax=Marmoricola sp. URHB0036 TaxID=1298863 RepID=UPI0004009A40|nr:cytochrome P450 [Marmoricola sp. URHB0036]
MDEARSLLLARHGYLFTAALSEAERRQLHETSAVSIPFLGRSSLLVTGDDGVRLFYDESRIMRHKAVPAPIATSLFGAGAVHGLDDQEHRHRKQLFLHALRQDELDRLVPIAVRRWRVQMDQWRRSGSGAVFPSAVAAFAGTIIEWAGVEESETEMVQHGQWLADIVDGFGVVGPAYAKAAVARRRCNSWATQLVRRQREHQAASAESWLGQVASFVDADGQPLPERTAAVELLNILRPAVAVSWLATFAALALTEHPEWRERLDEEDPAGPQPLAEAFAHEVRRYYPFVPVLAGRARHELDFAGQHIGAGHRVILDVYGTNHGREWTDPWAFDPSRFLGLDPCDVPHFVPQGGGPRESGHRCPGEGVANALVAVAVSELASLSPEPPLQDAGYSMRRMPTRPDSGIELVP